MVGNVEMGAGHLSHRRTAWWGPQKGVTPALKHKPGRAGRTAPELLAPGGCGTRHQDCTPQLCPAPWRGLELGVRVHSRRG